VGGYGARQADTAGIRHPSYKEKQLK
jgi:hypothetical protein